MLLYQIIDCKFSCNACILYILTLVTGIFTSRPIVSTVSHDTGKAPNGIILLSLVIISMNLIGSPISVSISSSMDPA